MSAEASNNKTFLFTSESVGEGHPGKFYFLFSAKIKKKESVLCVFLSNYVCMRRKVLADTYV